MSQDEELYDEYGNRKERRHTFTEAELQEIKDRLLESIYADIGKSIVKKFLWVTGAVCAAAIAWLAGSGRLP